MTWQCDVNRSVSESSNGFALRRFFYNIVAFLTGTMSWPVWKSANGTAVAVGSNNWPADPVNLLSYSWIVLTSPAGVQVCFSFGAAGVNIWGYIVSQGSNFSGGTTLARPTASDEIICGERASTEDYVDHFGAIAFTQHIAVNSDNIRFVSAVKLGTSKCSGVLGLDFVTVKSGTMYIPWRAANQAGNDIQMLGIGNYNALIANDESYAATRDTNNSEMVVDFASWVGGSQTGATNDHWHFFQEMDNDDPLTANNICTRYLAVARYHADDIYRAFPLNFLSSIVIVAGNVSFNDTLSTKAWLVLGDFGIPWDGSSTPL